MDRVLFDYVLRLGDDALILGQRLTEWCGRAPTVEVDLTLANLGLDLIGQATLFLDHAAKIEGGMRDADKLAFHRDAASFRNCVLVEQPNGDFAHTIVRQFLFSAWQRLKFERLAFSRDETIAAIAAKALKEIKYHADVAGEWMVRLGDGTDESNQRLTDGVSWMWRFMPELFATDEVDAEMINRGIGVDPAAFRADYDSLIASIFAQAKIAVPDQPRNFANGRRGHHSEHLGHLLCVMQYLPRTYPDATW